MAGYRKKSSFVQKFAAKLIFLALAAGLCLLAVRYFSWLADTRPGLMRLLFFGILAAGWAGLELDAIRGQSRRLRFGCLEGIDEMEGHTFEYWCADYLEKRGFSHVEVTQGAGDFGVDIIAWDRDVKYAIQCKRCAGPVGNKAVQEVYTGMRMYECDEAAVLTNSTFTEGAKRTAEQTDVQLWDRQWLQAHALD